LIPPSIYLIIFAQITNQSASDLWIAAFLPGLLTAFLLAVTVFIYTRIGNYKRPPSSTWAERGRSFRRAWPIMIMPILVLVPIYIGWYTPEESAAVAVAYTLFLGFVVYKELTLKKVWQSAVESAHLTSMVLIIIAAAFLLNQAFTYQRIPFEIADWFSTAGFSGITFPIVAILLFVVMGMFLDANSILVIVGPMLLPVVIALGINPVAYSVFICLMVEIACLTPPFGMVLFAATGIVKEDFAFVSKSVFYFYPALLVAAILIIYVPQISTFLGSLIH
jgi:C4-dicarboxylate transporter, DctM subunit